MNSKQILRQQYQAQRLQLSTQQRATAAQCISHRLSQLSCFQQAESIGIYSSIFGEVDTNPIRKIAYLQHKSCYFPIITTKNILKFLPTTMDTIFHKNKFGILEPNMPHNQAILANQLDLLCLPLVAFDQYGTRLGMGKGYYDKTLSKDKPNYCIGLAYELQYHPMLPRDPWDVPLSMIITENRIYLGMSLCKNN